MARPNRYHPSTLAVMSDHRITELELGYMALERLVEELSGVVAEQQKTITALAADVAMLNAKAGGLQEAERASPQDERPPHY
jgi:uncharacterized coiled-coil protein SlyX